MQTSYGLTPTGAAGTETQGGQDIGTLFVAVLRGRGDQRALSLTSLAPMAPTLDKPSGGRGHGA